MIIDLYEQKLSLIDIINKIKSCNDKQLRLYFKNDDEWLFEHSNPLLALEIIMLAINDNKNIISLDLSGNDLSSKRLEVIVRHLKASQTIETLDISKCYISDKRVNFVEDLLKESKISNIEINRNGFTSESAAKIASALVDSSVKSISDLGNVYDNFREMIDQTEKYKIVYNPEDPRRFV